MSRRRNQGDRTDPPKAPPIDATGATGLDHGFGLINEEKLLKLSGRRAVKEFREMHDNSGLVGGILRISEEMVAQTPWSVEAAGEDPSTDLIGKHLLETSLTDMQNTWQDFISEVMTMGVFGHAYMEHWYKKRLGDHPLKEFNSRYADGYYGIANIELRGQDSLDRWNIADQGDILGMWQRPAPRYNRLYVDDHRALHFRTRVVKNNPEGRSWLRPGWRSWWFVKRLQEMEGVGIERDVAGYPDWQAPLDYFLKTATTDQKAVIEDLKKQAERIRQDKQAGLVRPSEMDSTNMPTGFKFGLIQGGSRNASVFDTVIKRHESRIGISLLGEFMLLGQEKVGSFALSSDKTDMFAMAMVAVLRRIEDVINRRLSPRLMRANGLPGACAPKFKFGDIERTDVLAFSQAIAGLVSASVLTPDNSIETYVREYLSLPPLGEVSPGQLEDAVGSQNELIDSEPDNPGVDVEDVNRATVAVEAAADEAPPPESAAMTVAQAADFLSVSQGSISSALKRGKLPGNKVGAGWRILREDLMRYMAGGNSGATQ